MTQFTCKGVKQINNRISLNITFTFGFTIRISQRFPSAREFQMGNFQKYRSQNVGQDFIVLDFFHVRKILKVDGRDGMNPQNREKNAPAGRFTCMIVLYARTQLYRHSFFPDTIRIWNGLPQPLVESTSLETFKQGVLSCHICKT
jgi:hypothetical protein